MKLKESISGLLSLLLAAENFLLRLDGAGNPVLVLADFGSSLEFGAAASLQHHATPEYWPPEVWAQVHHRFSTR